jgi:hypothetical protein
MSCCGGHLGFPIGIKTDLVKDIPMIIHLQFGFSQFISFREEDLWKFSQSEHITGPGSHVEYPTGTKNSNFVEDHPRNISAKFGSNWPSVFGEDEIQVKFDLLRYVTFLISELCRGCHGRVRMVVFSSPEPKVQVNYCHHLTSVVCKLFTFQASSPKTKCHISQQIKFDLYFIYISKNSVTILIKSYLQNLS